MLPAEDAGTLGETAQLKGLAMNVAEVYQDANCHLVLYVKNLFGNAIKGLYLEIM